jgi:hypothetical protein
MKRAIPYLTILALLLSAGAAALRTADGGEAAARWRIRGDLTEACTCSVPCGCNFGQGPSPNHYCWALFSYGIRQGSYGGVKLDGLKIGAAAGEKGFVFYIDRRATPEQAEALKAIVRHIGATLKLTEGNAADPSLKLLGFKTAAIEQVVGERSCQLRLGDAGGFEAEYLIGIDGKTPIVVENNWSWNVSHCIKGKARRLRYQDEFGNRIDVESVNANQGKFDYSEKTRVFLR